MMTGQEMPNTVLVWPLKEEPGTSTEMILQMLSEYNISLLLAAVVVSFVPVVTGRHRSKLALTKLVTEYCQ